MYEATYWELAERIYGSGLASELLDQLAETVPVTDGLSEETLNSKVAELHAWIDQRTTALTDLRADQPSLDQTPVTDLVTRRLGTARARGHQFGHPSGQGRYR